MLYLKVTDLKKSYTSKVLIDGVDCTISKGQKVALVAKNGAGKTTFLKLLLDEEHPSDGTIERREGLDVAYLAQSHQLDDTQTVRDVLYNFDIDHEREQAVEMDIAVNKLLITPYLDQLVGSLSGGEKKRVALAKVLMGNPDMLILDEPTNHLDLSMIEWLEWYLKKTHVTLLLVTHDRYFLERVCTDIFELHRGKIVAFPGNYSYYLEKKAMREEHEQQQLHKLKQVYRHELSWMKRAPSGRQTKSTAREGRFAAIEDRYDENKDIMFHEQAKLVLSVEKRQLGGKIINLHKVKKSFGEKKILAEFSHEFRHNERIGIIGKNGVGKSTFVRILLGEEGIDNGKIQTGETVVFWHYQQKDIVFPADKRISDIVDNRKLLEQFLFPINQHHVLAENLSGGEKRRLHLLSILTTNPNFLILDEPTNDLDLVTIAVLEEFLLQYEWCLVVVSHDRFFMDRITDHLFVFEGDGVVNDFWGTYSEYSKEKEEQVKKKTKKALATVEVPSEDEPVKKKLSYLEKRELDLLMKELLELEARKDEINILLNNKDIHYDDIRKLSEELGKIIRLVEQKEYRWFELQG
jgi:ATP-binding cassette subfamily F protein uup